ncbi:MAG: M15 family metallopeptidase [Spirochaetales bacterium]|nr:M15 family metallopeptidase [Spirochaetales bacterium]
MGEIFVENMRDRFNWGGDWWYYTDYTHFEGRRDSSCCYRFVR